MVVVPQSSLSGAAIGQFQVQIPLSGKGDLEGSLGLEIQASKARDKSVFYDVVPGQTVTIGLHAHLLPEGQQDVWFRLSRDGEEIRSVKQTLDVPTRSQLGNQVRTLLEKNSTPLVFQGPCDSSRYPYQDQDAVPWFDRPDAQKHIDSRLKLGSVSLEEATELREFVEGGYVTLKNAIDVDLVDAVNLEIDQAIANNYGGYEYGSSQRIEHLHIHYPNVRKLWLDDRVYRFVDLLFGESAFPCQTLTYVFGSQQDAHQDTVHLTPFPAGYMCGIWVALQDVEPESGELVVYPGSHRERRVYLKEAGCRKVREGDWVEFGSKVVPIWQDMTKKYEEVVYRPTKGTVLIWHENLLHGGSLRVNQSLERRSIVIHTFSEGAIAYYDSTGLVGTMERSARSHK